ncbi:PRC-barrel domain containing protein [Aerophototrophica crusticola]|uniref:PRC-barrel domain containing protein n=1 Tax=Aerophototrophica crusticola TaxID=1709002 RepID=A0A858R532_9PROT|nr:PRC-barrel domain containing protein [Rhodospirillaceae bacterium B3]
MRKDLIGATSALALLLSGAAYAQGSTGPGGSPAGTDSATGSPPASSSPAPVTPSDTNRDSSQSMDRGTSDTTSAGAPGSMAPESSGTNPAGTTAGMTGSDNMGSTGMGTTAFDRQSAQELMGKTVVGANGQELGEVSDVVLDPSTGQAKQLVISSGGFLGIGERTVAVDMTQAQIQPGQDKVQVSSLTQDQLQAMKEFEYDDNTVSLSRNTDGEGSQAGSNAASRSGSAPNTSGTVGSAGENMGGTSNPTGSLTNNPGTTGSAGGSGGGGGSR